MASLPTPVAALHISGGRSVWVKQDHLSSPVYGGGKVRKLEYILAALRDSEVKRVLSIGAFGSHHLLALALHGSRAGGRARRGGGAPGGDASVRGQSGGDSVRRGPDRPRGRPDARALGVVKARMTGSAPPGCCLPGAAMRRAAWASWRLDWS